MPLLERLCKELLNESVSVNSVNDAIDTHTRVIINYHSKGEDIATGARIIEVYAYGLTKAGNPVIRAFQPYGDTTTRVPAWKFFRLDRISYWKPSKQTFSEPASARYGGLGEFNPNGDRTMSAVYKIANFGGDDTPDNVKNVNPSSPKMKTGASQQQPSGEVYKTDTEKNLARLRQQVQNPIKLSDIKTKQGFKTFKNQEQPKPTQSGPKLKGEPQQANPATQGQQQNNVQEPEVYKTDTERNMERLRQQLNNPRKIDLSKIPRK